ncbi:MAG TPA: preprotein translocase subunit SecG [Caulobacteraceae bacterium]|jgi:preprotein translocase subunit SecG|nr:preprotein translocase subunit SecG [Caulobacteraceae bacterium]
MLLAILLVFQIVVCVALVGVILLQRSEGGALGMGGGPTGFMTARGAGDLLTRTTAILATIFFVLSITLTIVAGHQKGGGSVVDRLKVDALNPDALTRPQPAPVPAQPAPPADGGPAAPSVFQAPAPQVNTAPAAPASGSVFSAPAAPAASAPSKPAPAK